VDHVDGTGAQADEPLQLARGTVADSDVRVQTLRRQPLEPALQRRRRRRRQMLVRHHLGAARQQRRGQPVLT
jgi:hypothetical protein